MSEKIPQDIDSRVTIRVSGLADDFLDLIPNGKKSAIISQILNDAIYSGRYKTSILTVFGSKNASKMIKKIERMTNLVGSVTVFEDKPSIGVSKNEDEKSSEKVQKSDFIDSKNDFKIEDLDGIIDVEVDSEKAKEMEKYEFE